MQDNIYLPYVAKIKNITTENEIGDLKTFEVEKNINFDFIPGQFCEVSIFGVGEAPFGIASSPQEDNLLFTVKKLGKLTSALHDAEIDEVIGVRGPLGNGYPIDKLKGKNVIIIGGGFAFTTLRSLILYIQNNRAQFKDLIVIYGARNEGELMYKKELQEWLKREDTELILTVDRATTDTWQHKVGLIPDIVKEVKPSPKDAYCLVCGPPIMIKFTLPVLKELKFEDYQIILSLEMRMKCGIGKCGRCNIGNVYVCKDGPVFTYDQLKQLPAEY